MRAIVVLTLLLTLTGCAARGPSSTDNHHRVPEVYCHLVKYEGSIRKMCCVGSRCWFAD